jgi:hypothetical protein
VILIIFGVSGAAKTTVGKLLAHKLGWRFLEADDFHPAANVEKRLVAALVRSRSVRDPLQMYRPSHADSHQGSSRQTKRSRSTR